MVKGLWKKSIQYIMKYKKTQSIYPSPLILNSNAIKLKKETHGFIQLSVFILKMDTLLPSSVKMPFFDTELLNLHCLFKIKFAVSTVLVMIYPPSCLFMCIIQYFLTIYNRFFNIR